MTTIVGATLQGSRQSPAHRASAARPENDHVKGTSWRIKLAMHRRWKVSAFHSRSPISTTGLLAKSISVPNSLVRCMFSNQLGSTHNPHRGKRHTCSDALIFSL